MSIEKLSYKKIKNNGVTNPIEELIWYHWPDLQQEREDFLNRIQKAVKYIENKTKELNIMKEYTEGIQGGNVVILEDGIPITITKILRLLNEKEISKNEIQHNVSNIPTFEEWIKKYFEKPVAKIMYKTITKNKTYSLECLKKKYNKAYKGNCC